MAYCGVVTSLHGVSAHGLLGEAILAGGDGSKNWMVKARIRKR